MPPSRLSSCTEVSELSVVWRPATAMSSSAVNVIRPLPASISAPSVIVSAPLAAPPSSTSATTVTEPAPEAVTSPSAPNRTSSFAWITIFPSPLARRTPSTTMPAVVGALPPGSRLIWRSASTWTLAPSESISTPAPEVSAAPGPVQ